MTAKLSGTDGLLQQYDYQTPTTGFSYTFAAGTQVLVMNPAGTLATGTITMPASPSDGMTITFSSSQQITALTVQGNTGQSMSNAVTFLPGKTAASYVYRLSNTTWYPTQTVPGTGSQLVSGVSQNSTSGTNIDFTGIPSWVKRITVMLNGVSTSSTSPYQIQLGAGSIDTASYITSCTSIQSAAASSQSGTTGFYITTSANMGAPSSLYGNIAFSLLGSNTWTGTGAFGREAGSNTMFFSAGVKALSGTLDRIRITTVNGTDTFDAGSINILYE